MKARTSKKSLLSRNLYSAQIKLHAALFKVKFYPNKIKNFEIFQDTFLENIITTHICHYQCLISLEKI